MKKLVLVLATIPMLTFGQRINDGLKHKLAGNVISLGVGAVTYEITGKKGFSIAAGFGAGILAGVLKEEIYDKRMKKGVYSEEDMIDTGFGAAVGTIMLAVYVDERGKRKQRLERSIKLID